MEKEGDREEDHERAAQKSGQSWTTGYQPEQPQWLLVDAMLDMTVEGGFNLSAVDPQLVEFFNQILETFDKIQQEPHATGIQNPSGIPLQAQTWPSAHRQHPQPAANLGLLDTQTQSGKSRSHILPGRDSNSFASSHQGWFGNTSVNPQGLVHDFHQRQFPPPPMEVNFEPSQNTNDNAEPRDAETPHAASPCSHLQPATATTQAEASQHSDTLGRMHLDPVTTARRTRFEENSSLGRSHVLQLPETVSRSLPHNFLTHFGHESINPPQVRFGSASNLVQRWAGAEPGNVAGTRSDGSAGLPQQLQHLRASSYATTNTKALPKLTRPTTSSTGAAKPNIAQGILKGKGSKRKANGRSNLQHIEGYPPADAPLPDDLDFESICMRYPNHLDGDLLVEFFDAGWRGREIYSLVPTNKATENMKKRPHNFMEARINRAAKNRGRDPQQRPNIERTRAEIRVMSEEQRIALQNEIHDGPSTRRGRYISGPQQASNGKRKRSKSDEEMRNRTRKEARHTQGNRLRLGHDRVQEYVPTFHDSWRSHPAEAGFLPNVLGGAGHSNMGQPTFHGIFGPSSNGTSGLSSYPLQRRPAFPENPGQKYQARPYINSNPFELSHHSSFQPNLLAAAGDIMNQPTVDPSVLVRHNLEEDRVAFDTSHGEYILNHWTNNSRDDPHESVRPSVHDTQLGGRFMHPPSNAEAPGTSADLELAFNVHDGFETNLANVFMADHYLGTDLDVENELMAENSSSVTHEETSAKLPETPISDLDITHGGSCPKKPTSP